ncbi:hypothetical protein ACIPM0_18945 [Pseudomonas sichuanensis]|uniref:hypothetical protein n=1 Tax=Pseudomonas TaxID=286 RepID=UPI003810C395
MSAVRRQAGEQAHAAFLVLNLLGAGYLIYLGLRQLLARNTAAPSCRSSSGRAADLRPVRDDVPVHGADRLHPCHAETV